MPIEFSADRAALFAAIHKTQGVVDRRTTSNVLAHILVESTGPTEIRLSGTDYDVTITATVPALVKRQGKAAINGKSLFDVVRNMDDGELTAKTLPNDWVEVTAGRSHFKLAGISPADFPEITEPKDVTWVKLDRASVRDVFDKTAFSMSDDETRMNLNGVFFQVTPKQIVGVSTDGHRLSVASVPIEGDGPAKTLSAIVHKKGVGEVKRLLDGHDATVDIGFARGAICFRAGGVSYLVRQIEDNFPDFTRVIPEGGGGFRVKREALAKAVKRVAMLTSNKTFVIKLSVEPGKVVLSASNPDYGEGRDEVDCEYDGKPIAIGFNFHYLLDVLAAIDAGDVTIAFKDEFSPALVTASDDPGATFVVMPMRA